MLNSEHNKKNKPMKTTILRTREAVIEYLEGLDDNELVSIWNEHCQSSGSGDDEIYSNDEDFFNTFFDGKVIEAIRAVSYGEYSYNHEWVIFNGYANLESSDSPTEWIDLSEIADDILENEQNFYDIELEDVPEATKVIVKQISEDNWGLFNEDDEIVDQYNSTYEDAVEWAQDDDNDFEFVESFE